MLNEKMYRLGSARSEIRELFEYGRARKAEIGEENVHDFSLGNPSVPCPDEVSDAMAKLIKEVDPVSLHGYTSAQGDVKVREAIANDIAKRYGVKVCKDDLYLTVGAAAALTCALTALVCPGEEVILLAPFFPEYKVFVERTGAAVSIVMCDEESFEPNAENLRKAINEKTAAVIINSPNNPTGAVYSEECIRAVAKVLEECSNEIGHPIYLIADEPYRELVYDGISVPFIPSYYTNTVVCYSYSKSLSIPGERIGYCLVNPEANDSQRIYAAICGAGRALGFVCAPSLLQKVIPHCLGITSDISVYDENRQLLLTKLTDYGYKAVEPKGAFYLFIKSPIPDAKLFSEIAKKHELLLVPSDSFGYPGYLRISYCVKTEQIERALPAFREAINDALRGDKQ
ncbi:MAG: pyridoxal phosphate-dependent aminotransferase [Clostridia bacterium]|nr:pyridoxal phosphate-dependent aminotransferase [Clostridia bacterium]